MLSSADRKKLKSKVSELKALLIKGFNDHATSRYYLAITNPEKRSKELHDKNPMGLREWELLQKKLDSSGLSFDDYIKERSYTYLNRTFFLMRLEMIGIQKYPVFKGMKNSSGWKEFSQFCPNLCKEEDEGFLFLTRQVSDYYARELPGLFLDDSADRAFGIPRKLIFDLFSIWNEIELENIFKDDTTAGWIYQYWNDPDREAINERVQDKGKVSGKEIASATQLFTERYMVEWLIQNSLGNLWLAICKKNQWKTSAEECIENLRKRRGDHNQKIAKKTISEDTPLQILSDEEEHWKYYLERELTQDEIDSCISSIRDVKLLDPACGSGHFLLYAFYMLFYLYKEEDRIKKSLDANHISLTDTEIAKSILENNLHGIDLDPRAVQIAVASLYTSAKRYGKLNLIQMNLVATRPSIGSGTSKESLDFFVSQFCSEVNITPDMARSLIELLGKSDVLGSLLQIRSEIQSQIASYSLYEQESEENIFRKIEDFVKKHDIGNDLGLFTMGQQLSRGLRLLTLLDHKYDVVVANPPYLSQGKVEEDANIIFTNGATELYESFIYCYKNRIKKGGFFALLTAHNFLFIEKFKSLRAFLLENYTLDTLAQLGVWTFKEITQSGALGIACFILRNDSQKTESLFLRIGGGNFKRDVYIKEPYLLNQSPNRLYHFDQRNFADIEGSPMIYWWTKSFRDWYLKAKKVGDVGETLSGSQTNNNDRFLKMFWELNLKKIYNEMIGASLHDKVTVYGWVPYVKGANGERWVCKFREVIKYYGLGLEWKIDVFHRYNSQIHVKPIDKFFKQGIAYSYIGVDDFYCRLRKYKSIFDVSGSTIFVPNPEETQVALSSGIIPFVSQSINPTINNQVGDIKNLPIPKVEHWKEYIERARVLYDEEFSREETNIEYEYRGEGR